MKKILFTLFLLILFFSNSFASNIFIARTNLGFPEAMSILQENIKKYNYKLSHVQRIDIGLTSLGYKTDKYRVVFYGRTAEYRKIIKATPKMIAFLPLKISIFAENNDTIITALNPQVFKAYVKDKQLKKIFDNYTNDLDKIFTNFRLTHD
jgi:uncharacterized protein (DUF302 family)